MQRPLKRRAIALRTAFLVMGVMAAAGLVALAASGRIARNWETARQREALEALLGVVAPDATAACYVGDPDLGGQVVRGLARTPGVRGAALRSGTTILAQAGENGGSGLSASRWLTSPFNSESVVGELILRADPAAMERQVARTAALLRNWLLALTLVLGLAMAYVINVTIVRPIRVISDRLHSLDPDQEGQLTSPKGHDRDELGQLVEDVNDLVRRLRAALDKERHLSEQLSIDKRKVQAILDNAEAGIFALRGDGALEAWTPAFLVMLGLEHAAPRPGTPLAPLFGPGAAQVERCLEQVQLEHAPAVEILRAGDPAPQGLHWLKLSLNPVGPDWIQGLIEAMPAQFSQSSEDRTTRDPQTGAFNRLAAERAIADHLSNDIGGLALMLVSLESLDDPGRELPLDLLRVAAHRLARPLRASDLVVHLEGREFLLILRSLEGAPRALAIAQEVLATLADPIPQAGGVLARLGASVGIALLEPEEEPSRQTLLKRADVALKRARQEGPNHCRLG